MKKALLDLELGWQEAMKDEFNASYFQDIHQFLQEAESDNKIHYPSQNLIFQAFNFTPWKKVKVVLLGQDPYHNPGQAMGLSFSVPKGIKTPPSLKNIYKELHTDLGVEIPDHGDLSDWAKQGVLLLNAMLTVEHKKPGSHKKIGWQVFTNAVIKKLSEDKRGLVFLLWGNFAKSKKELINAKKHLVLEAAHPSPLARGAFFGSKHFSKTNAYLTKNNKSAINWKI